MRTLAILAGLGLCLAALPAGATGGALPSDVQSGHWASAAVQEVLDNHVMDLPDGRHFRGESLVTRAQASIALAKLARELTAGTWHASPSRPVPSSVEQRLGTTDWQNRPVTRYVLAASLARSADYVTNGLRRPGPQDKDLAKSIAFPDIPEIKVARTNPAYSSLAYLANNHMVWGDSPLLHTGSQPLRGGEMAHALTEMITGVNNRLTPLGHDESGSTPDKTFHLNKGKGASGH